MTRAVSSEISSSRPWSASVPEGRADAIDEGFVAKRSADAYVVEIDGEAVVLDERANRLHHLNHTATLIWNCLDGEIDVGGLAREIGEELDLPVDEVLTDTLAVVRELGAEGLLAGVEPSDESEAAT
jgi:hypothetical protein